MTDNKSKRETMSLEEATISEIAAIVELLERKGIGTNKNCTTSRRIRRKNPRGNGPTRSAADGTSNLNKVITAKKPTPSSRNVERLRDPFNSIEGHHFTEDGNGKAYGSIRTRYRRGRIGGYALALILRTSLTRLLKEITLTFWLYLGFLILIQ